MMLSGNGSSMINKHIANYSDEQWDNALDLVKRLTPAQMAQALRGDFSAGLMMGVLARNPGLVASGGKKFLDVMLERINRPAGNILQ
jgi:digeranylgeranylglycerophospholipid reductase